MSHSFPSRCVSELERVEVLAQRRQADIRGVLELGDRPLGHVGTTGQLGLAHGLGVAQLVEPDLLEGLGTLGRQTFSRARAPLDVGAELGELVSRHQISRSEEHTSELQSLMRISYAVFCLKKKNKRIIKKKT